MGNTSSPSSIPGSVATTTTNDCDLSGPCISVIGVTVVVASVLGVLEG